MSDQPTPAAVAPAAEPPQMSLRDQLRASRKAAQNRQTKAFEIPGYDPPIYGTFKALDDYADARGIVLEHQNEPDEAARELLIACDTFVASCTEIYPVINGVRAALEIPAPGFTPAVAAELVVETDAEGEDVLDEAGDPVPVKVDNARQAVLAIFPNTLSIMTLFAEIDAWFQNGAGPKSDRVLAGNSPAPS